MREFRNRGASPVDKPASVNMLQDVGPAGLENDVNPSFTGLQRPKGGGKKQGRDDEP